MASFKAILKFKCDEENCTQKLVVFNYDDFKNHLKLHKKGKFPTKCPLNCGKKLTNT